jgi:hypothetical protein
VFVSDPDPGKLHQGEVFAPMMFPKWNVNTFKLSGHHQNEKLEGGVVDVLAYEDLDPDEMGMDLREPQPVPMMLCSQGCEIDNLKGTLGLLVCPILDPDRGMDEEQEAKFRNSYTLADEQFEYIEQFPVELDGHLLSARFSGIMALGPPKNVIGWLLQRKQHQLTDEFRRGFRLKLGHYFGRAEED